MYSDIVVDVILLCQPKFEAHLTIQSPDALSDCATLSLFLSHFQALIDQLPFLTLPTSKEGGFLLQRSPPGREPGLTQSPQAYRFGCVPPYQIISYDSKRRPSFRMFFAAFKSTSWIAPQQGHSQCSLKRLLNALFRYPQTLQTCVLGNKASICTNGLCCHAHL